MKIISYNCRGLGSDRAVKRVLNLVNMELPNILFLMETKCSANYVQSVSTKLGYANCFATNSHGRGGGIALFWDQGISLSISSFTSHHFDVLFLKPDGTVGWRTTFLYGWPEAHNKIHTWNLLKGLAGNQQTAWLYLGDFNQILFSCDKLGGAPACLSAMTDFHDSLDFCGLSQVPWSGGQFTWTNGRKGSNFIQEKLDRAFACSSWLDQFPNACIKNLGYWGSDHAPISVIFGDDSSPQGTGSTVKPKRFEAMWIDAQGYSDIVSNAWVNGASNTWAKVHHTMNALGQWSRSDFGNLKIRLRIVQGKISACLSYPSAGNNGEVLFNLKREEEDLLKRQEMMWYQRSCANEFKCGDRNTRYFHTKASKRKCRNRVLQLQKGDGSLTSNFAQMQEIVQLYFQNIFSSNSVEIPDVLLQGIPRRISDEDNAFLISPFTEAEVINALNHMHPMKSPGPDGMPALFYKHHWPLVGKDVMSFVLDILNGGDLPSKLNHTFLSLIPKVLNPKQTSDLRPISLCNVIYKIMSKCLTNRLKGLLNGAISESQSAFINGRSITDNGLVAAECFHYLKKKKTGRRGYMAIKLDMAKAYDRVEWNFLIAVMQRMGFHQQWISLIFKCISTVSFAVLLNGVPSPCFTPQRGLRQGDPLSPSLFLLVMEGLSSLFTNAFASGRLHGIKIARTAPHVTHLLFADDCMIFARANRSTCQYIQNILSDFQAGSGQMVNIQKSKVSFSPNVGSTLKNELLQMLGFLEVDSHENYLGLPMVIGRSKKLVFQQVVDKVRKKAKGWKSSSLSQAGREVLIKSVLQAIPTYIMCCFKLPVSVCLELESIVAKFWWGSQEQNKIHWSKWSFMCKNKDQGGLGFRSFEAFNLALLAKQAWRILVKPFSLVANVLKARYFPHSDVLNASLGNSPSYAWRSIFEALWVIKKGSFWGIGNGESVRFWNGKWLPRPHSFSLISPAYPSEHDLKVCDFIDWTTSDWKWDDLNTRLMDYDIQAISRIHVVSPSTPDFLCWFYAKDGNFTVKSAYRMILQVQNDEGSSASGQQSGSLSPWKQIWKLGVIPKVKNFLWRALNDFIPYLQKLKARKIIDCDICSLCMVKSESFLHVMKCCPFAMDFWSQFPTLSAVISLKPRSFWDWWCSASQVLYEADLCLWTTSLWSLWHNRNCRIFEKIDCCPVQLMIKVLAQSQTPSVGANSVIHNLSQVASPLVSFGFRLYCDACLVSDGAAIGFVLLSPSGSLVVLGSKALKPCTSIESVEAQAVVWGLEMASSFGVLQLSAFSDCLALVRMCDSRLQLRPASGSARQLRTTAAQFISLILQLRSSFVSCNIRHISRINNVLANTVAHFGLSLPSQAKVVFSHFSQMPFSLACKLSPLW